MKSKKKKNTLVVIDGENVSSRRYSRIKKEIRKVGEIDISKVYGLQKDPRTKGWSEEAKKDGQLKDIRLCGGPSKNKVDCKIKKDVKKTIDDKKGIDIVVIVSSDSDYSDIANNMRKQHKKVVVIGEKKTPKKLRDSCSLFVEI